MDGIDMSCSDDIPSFDMFISPEYLMDLHKIGKEEATLLWQFSISNTIRYKECYGDGQIIYPMFKKALSESEQSVKALIKYLK